MMAVQAKTRKYVMMLMVVMMSVMRSHCAIHVLLKDWAEHCMWIIVF